MNTTFNSNNTSNPTPATRPSGGIVAGGILIFIGLLSLTQYIPGFNLDNFFLPALAAVFLAAGLLSRKVGLLIPGGIIMGVGVGAWLQDGVPLATEMAHGGVFFLAMAGGFALISLAAALIGRRMVWPLFPAAGTGLFGALLMFGEPGLRFLELSGYVWPLVLIALGVYLVVRRK
jgi:hypothetical protein